MARLSVDVHRIGTSSVTVVGWPARTRVTLMFQVPVAGKVAPRTETWLAVMGTTSSRLGGMSAVPAVISTASTRSEAHTSEPQSLMRISYAVFCLQNTTPSQSL